jgi:hypothetical protein
VKNVRTMNEMIAASLSGERFTMLPLGAFAGLALLLAVVGIYSVTSYSVSRRTNEIGIRVALGASRMNVMMLVVRHGVMLAMVGLAIGAGGAVLLSGVMRSQLWSAGYGSGDVFGRVGSVDDCGVGGELYSGEKGDAGRSDGGVAVRVTRGDRG